MNWVCVYVCAYERANRCACYHTTCSDGTANVKTPLNIKAVSFSSTSECDSVDKLLQTTNEYIFCILWLEMMKQERLTRDDTNITPYRPGTHIHIIYLWDGCKNQMSTSIATLSSVYGKRSITISHFTWGFSDRAGLVRPDDVVCCGMFVISSPKLWASAARLFSSSFISNVESTNCLPMKDMC